MSSQDQVDPAAARKSALVRWTATFGGDPPARLSTTRMERAIRYAEQVANDPALVRLDRQVKRRLKQLSRQTQPRSSKLLPGTRVLREWGGTTHEVTVTDKGYVYRGMTYRSLSVIAEIITGSHWSGPKFFGIT